MELEPFLTKMLERVNDSTEFDSAKLMGMLMYRHGTRDMELILCAKDGLKITGHMNGHHGRKCHTRLAVRLMCIPIFEKVSL